MSGFFPNNGSEDLWDRIYCDDDKVRAWLNSPEYTDSFRQRIPLTNSDRLRLLYCEFYKDRGEVWQAIKSDKYLYKYCVTVKDRKEVRSKIKSNLWAYAYCAAVKDRASMRQKITDPEWAYYYCRNIKDRKEVRKHIKKSETWLAQYNWWLAGMGK